MTALAIVESDLALISQIKAVVEEAPGAKAYVARRTEEAALYLKGVGTYSDREAFPFPSAVILDTHSPAGEDLAFIDWLRESGPKNLSLIVLADVPSHGLRVHCLLDEWTAIIPRGNLDEVAAFLLQKKLAAPPAELQPPMQIRGFI